MSGVTKHIFNQEVRDILSMWDCEIKTIEVRFNKLCKRVESKQKIISKCFGLYLSFKRHNY